MFCHLMHHSVRVTVGDLVRLGQPIARVGNSGNTTEPHLHLQAQNSATGLGDVEKVDASTLYSTWRTYPLVFRNVTLVRAGHTTRPIAADPRRGDRIQPFPASLRSPCLAPGAAANRDSAHRLRQGWPPGTLASWHAVKGCFTERVVQACFRPCLTRPVRLLGGNRSGCGSQHAGQGGPEGVIAAAVPSASTRETGLSVGNGARAGPHR